MREQLLSVITHAHVTIIVVNAKHQVTMLEGALLAEIAKAYNSDPEKQWYIGRNIKDVLRPVDHSLAFLKPMKAILQGQTSSEVVEHQLGTQAALPSVYSLLRALWSNPTLGERWYRTRLVPCYKGADICPQQDGLRELEGVIGIIQDVTELKRQEQALEEQEKEHRQLLANEAAAKEASQLKSRFLANVSLTMAHISSLLTAGDRCHTKFGHPSVASSVCRSCSWRWNSAQSSVNMPRSSIARR